ncbi:MAG: phenylalanine--tRNA ligase subunit beta, partial [Euzebyales bacterium]|nr:phenylalanine--tRNA ligase subunit beta [Euzebyales bacterium]
MRVPLSWLHEFVRPDLGVHELAGRLTLGGLVVERIHQPSAGVRGVVVARVEHVSQVAGSDKLHLVEAFDGEHTEQVVCGAANYAPGDLVAWARPGATLPSPDPAHPVVVGRKTLIGVVSNGMLASARELGVGDGAGWASEGIWVLDSGAPLGAEVGEWLGLDDPVLELDLNPDRGYAQSILGVARDVAALTGAELTLPEVPEGPCSTPDPPDPGVPVTIADPDRCPRFDARRIVGVHVGSSPAWLQRRLAAAGVRPISNVVDATNHAMLETGNPIHAYDTALLAGPLIEVRVARPAETLRTLDGVERTLDPDDLVIADRDGPVALAGVMGGERSEIHPATRDVLLETANFSAGTVLRSARRQQLFTEGSRRWEKQVPPETVPLAAGRCAALIVRLAGGRVTGCSDTYPAPRDPTVIRLRTERARRRLGMDLDDERQAALLAGIACDVAVRDDGALAVTAPAYRPDLRLEEDLYEELARLEGYDRVPERVAASGRVGGRLPEHAAAIRVRQSLAGAGWIEVMPFPFLAPSDLDALGLDAGDRRRSPVALVNPLSNEESVLATTLLPGLLRVVRRNVSRQVDDVAVFSASRAFLPPTADEPGAEGGPASLPGSPVLPAEPLLLGLAACGAFD